MAIPGPSSTEDANAPAEIRAGQSLNTNHTTYRHSTNIISIADHWKFEGLPRYEHEIVLKVGITQRTYPRKKYIYDMT